MTFLEVKSILEAVARRYGYDPALLAGQAWQESRFNPTARSKAGAVGLLQFMPGTWGDWGRGLDPEDPEASADAGVRYMRSLLARYGAAASPVALALAAYNWGLGNVDRVIKETGRTDWEGIAPRLPRETRDYVPAVMNRATFYRAAFSPAVAGPVVALLGLVAFFFARRVMA